MFSPSSRPGPDARPAQERLHIALQMAPIWVFEQDMNLHYTWLQNAETQGNAGGASDFDLMERPEEARQVVEIKAGVLATGRAETVEVIAHVGGVAKRHRLHLEPLRDPDGRIRGLRGAILDLGDVSSPNDPTGASELMRLVGHELRNAVNPIRMLVQLERRRAQNSPSAPAGLATAYAGVERLTRLLEDMLDFGRSASEPIEVDLLPVALQDVLHAAQQRFTLLYPEAVNRFDAHVAPKDVWVRADQSRLIQVLLALLERAARTTERGERIAVRSFVDGTRVRLEISDQGAGLPARAPEHLDDPVGWARICLEDRRDEPPFTFALVGLLTRAMRGRLTVGAAPGGRGTHVMIELPRAEPLDPTTPAEGRARILRIMVVDDAPAATQTLRLLLEGDGHQVLEAQSGQQALRLAQGHTFDVVLLDLGLPDMAGHAVARRIRDEIVPCPILIALTGRSSDQDRKETRDAGFDQHLVKPVDMAGLRRALAGL